MTDTVERAHSNTYVACCALCFVARCATLALALPEIKMFLVRKLHTVSTHQGMEVRMELEKVFIVKMLGWSQILS
jgi:hypothetical protein